MKAVSVPANQSENPVTCKANSWLGFSVVLKVSLPKVQTLIRERGPMTQAQVEPFGHVQTCSCQVDIDWGLTSG